jgi:hypothetical protein
VKLGLKTKETNSYDGRLTRRWRSQEGQALRERGGETTKAQRYKDYFNQSGISIPACERGRGILAWGIDGGRRSASSIPWTHTARSSHASSGLRLPSFLLPFTAFILILLPALSHAQQQVIRLWGTYYGNGGGGAHDVTVNPNDSSIYITGNTNDATMIATPGAHQTSAFAGAAFLVKFNSSGDRLWGTYYGDLNTWGNAVAVNSTDGSVYLYGNTTFSGGFGNPGPLATPGVFQTHNPGPYNSGATGDAYIAKFNSNGVRLWCTYYGTIVNENTARRSLGVNLSDGSIYVCGVTDASMHFATTSAHQTSNHGQKEGFLARFNAFGQRMWGTFYGSFSDEMELKLDVYQADGSVYLCGTTSSMHSVSPLLYSPGAHQTTFGGVFDAFLAKFDSSGQRLWATYYGGTSNDQAHGVVVNQQDGSVYLSGSTSSWNGIATPGAHQTAPSGNPCGFLVKFSSSGSRLWGTYVGAPSGPVSPRSISINNNTGSVYISGNVGFCNGFATSGAFQSSHAGGMDTFIVKFSSSGQRLWATCFGGSADDFGYSIAIDNSTRSIYLAGETNSNTGITTQNGHQPTKGIVPSPFLVKFAEIYADLSAVPSCMTLGQSINVLIPSSAGECPPVINLSATGVPPGLSFNNMGSSATLVGTPNLPGTYNLSVTAQNSCWGFATFTKTIKVIATSPNLPNYTSQNGMVGQSFSFNAAGTVDPNAAPGVYSVTPALPSGLTLNTSTGIITGTPNAVGTTSHTITLKDSCNNTDSKMLTLNIINNQPCSPLSLMASATAPSCNSIQVNWSTGVGCGGYFMAIRHRVGSGPWTEIPAGSRPAITANTYTITGLTPNTTYEVQIQTLTPQSGWANPTQWITVANVTTPAACAPTITGPASQTVCQGSNVNIQLNATHSPTSYAQVGGVLPTGLLFNTFTGTINGTPTATGTFSYSLVTTNACGSATGTLSLTIQATPPPPTLLLTQARMRVTHGGGYQGDVALPLSGTLTGVDPRGHGLARELVLIFNNPNITSISVTPQLGTMTLGTPVYAGNQVRIPISGMVNNAKYELKINLVNGIALTGTDTVKWRIIRGDFDGNGTVNSIDVANVTNRIGQTVGATNFRADINGDGNINTLDVTQTQSNLGAAVTP